jgi:lipopolysaccharide export system protein LptA
MRLILNSKYRLAFLKHVACIAVAFSSVSAFALPSDRNQQLSLVADRATYNDKTGITTYTGNVVIEQGTMKLQADSIVATLNSKKKFKPLLQRVNQRSFSSKWM